MNTDILFIVVAIFIVLLFSLIFSAIKKKSDYFYAKRPIMTHNELDFFHRLVRANEKGYVFPQVAMSSLISPVSKNRKSRMAAFNKISRKRVDYAIYTDKLELLCIVELDDRTHNAARDSQRDSMLESSGIQTIRWHSKKKPDVSTIKSRFEQLKNEGNSGSFESQKAAH